MCELKTKTHFTLLRHVLYMQRGERWDSAPWMNPHLGERFFDEVNFFSSTFFWSTGTGPCVLTCHLALQVPFVTSHSDLSPV